MLIYYIAIFILPIIGIKIQKNGFSPDYLAKENTNAIKGIFLLFIFISHSIPYLLKCGFVFDGISNHILRSINIAMGQLVVVMFLFYSGYGVGESYKRKGNAYVKRMPVHRFLNTLLNYDVAVLFFIILSVSLSIPLSLKQCLLTLVAWDSIGNSNWYIFCILICYLISFVVLKVGFLQKNPVINTFVLTIIVSLFISVYKEPWWYNTMWAYAIGFTYSIYKAKFEDFIQNKYLFILIFLFVIFILLFILKIEFRGVRYNLLSISFALLLVTISMKIIVNNKILCWVGFNLFPMYIYQRLPMLYLSHEHCNFCVNNPVIFVALSFIATVCISYFYKYWQIKL